MLRELKILIFSKYDKQVDLARVADIEASKLSRIVRERSKPTPAEVAALRAALGEQIDKIFAAASKT